MPPHTTTYPTVQHLEIMLRIAAGEQPGVIHERPRLRITMVSHGWIGIPQHEPTAPGEIVIDHDSEPTIPGVVRRKDGSHE